MQSKMRFAFLVSFCTIMLSAALHAEDYAVTSIAGTSGVSGSTDGSPARFSNPYGVAIDAAKNLYVADTTNNTIRKITPAGVVSTLAGSAGLFGATDATGTAARFNFPVGVAVDASGNVYVADVKNSAIRKVTPAGVVTTFAGAMLQFGSTDGAAASARFFLPSGVAVDSAGNVYVADTGNHTIRKITAAGDVSTLAGAAQQPGFADGTGSAARFSQPWAVAVDASGNVFVADSGNNAVRKITSSGVVTTVAGSSTNSGATDGPVATARFNNLRGVAVDGSGNIYVSDYGNEVIRLIAGGNVSTIAGTPGVVGAVDSVGANVRLYDPIGIVADGTTIYIADSSNNLIRKGVPASQAPLPVILAQPLTQTVNAGQSVSFNIIASGNSLSYQWLKNGFAIAGATNASYAIASAQDSDAAVYSVHISSPGASTDSAQAPLTVVPPGSGPITARPLSQTVSVGQGVSFAVTATGSGLTYQWSKNNTAIAGATNSTYTIASAQTGDAGTYSVRVATSSGTFEIGTATLAVITQSIGSISITTQPANQTVNAGQSATFTVVASGSGLSYQWLKAGTIINGATNSSYTIASVQAADAGNYSVRVSATGTTVESTAASLTVNAAPPPTSARLINLSILTPLSVGETMTVGTVIGGSGTSGNKALVARAAGPSLQQLGVTAFLPDPTMTLTNTSTQTTVDTNDNWGGSDTLRNAFAAVGAFAYISPTSKDAGVYETSLPPANYTVQVKDTGTGTGTVIAELYDATPTDTVTATTPRLINVSVLKQIDTGASLTAGFVISGPGTKKVLIRAVGPTLGTAPFNISTAMADPKLELHDSTGAVIQSNDNWGGDPAMAATMASVGAFALNSPTSKDAVLLVTLPANNANYTATVSPNGTGGTAIVEVYEVP